MYTIDLNAGTVTDVYHSPQPQEHAGFGSAISLVGSGQVLIGEPALAFPASLHYCALPQPGRTDCFPKHRYDQDGGKH